MKFIDIIRTISRETPEGATPQQIRARIKTDYPERYGTEAHRRNVEKGQYTSLDHALLAEIYIATRQAPDDSWRLSFPNEPSLLQMHAELESTKTAELRNGPMIDQATSLPDNARRTVWAG